MKLEVEMLPANQPVKVEDWPAFLARLHEILNGIRAIDLAVQQTPAVIKLDNLLLEEWDETGE